MNETWLQSVLVRHDPLAAWPGAGAEPTDYRREAQLAAADLRATLGLGHARTVVADALDRVHPGLYAAAAVADARHELNVRLSRIAREIWDHTGFRRGSVRAPVAPTATAPPVAPPPEDLVRDDSARTDWLREIEERLATEVNVPGGPRGPAATALLAAFPALVDAYLDVADERRAAVRLSVSRFRRVCYWLSGFAAMQARLLDGLGGAEALRRCLAAESLLDLHTDWRDELLLLRDVRRIAAANRLPFAQEIARVADRSSSETARFLRGLLGEG